MALDPQELEELRRQLSGKQTSSTSPLTSMQLDELRNRIRMDTEVLDPMSARVDVLKNVMDLYTRPSRGIQQGIINAWDEPSVESKAQAFGKGLVQGGISGTTAQGADVAGLILGEDAPNWQKATLGFGLDVALDPTTYTSAGLVKGMSKQAAKTKAARLLGQIDPEKAPAYTSLVKEIRDNSPGEAYIRFALPFSNKGITFSSQKAYTKVRNAVESLAFDEQDKPRALAAMFSRQAELPGGSADIVRIQEMKNAAAFRRELQPFSRLTRGLSDEEAYDMAIAMDLDKATAKRLNLDKFINPETGEYYDNPIEYLRTIDAPLEAQMEGINTLYDLAMVIKKGMYDPYWIRESKLGFHGKNEYNPNYNYRVFLNKQAGKGTYRIPVGGMDSANFVQKRKANISLIEAENLGLKPITDIRDIVALRSAKHYQLVTRTKALHEVVGEYGVAANKNNAGFLSKSPDWVQVPKAFSNETIKGLKDIYVPREIADGLNKIESLFQNESELGKLLRGYDTVMREWRFLATALPQTQARNMVSDYIFNLIDGVYNPANYSKSAKVLASAERINMNRLLGEKVEYPTVTIGKSVLPVDKVLDVFSDYGGQSGYIATDVYNTNPTLGKSLGSATGIQLRGAARAPYRATKAKLGNVRELGENYMRLAHFIDAWTKELGDHVVDPNTITKFGITDKTTRDAVLRATKRVRKYNLDYGNKTTFEKRYASRVANFYSFMRQSIPMAVELLFTRPDFIATYAKGQNLAENLLSGGPDTPEEEALVSSYVRELAPFRVKAAQQKQKQKGDVEKLLDSITGGRGKAILNAGAKAVGGDEESDIYLTNLGTPFEQLRYLQAPATLVSELSKGPSNFPTAIGRTSKEAGKTVLGSISPLLRAPVEASFDESLVSGADIEDSRGGWAQWLAGQVPETRLAYQGYRALSGGVNETEGQQQNDITNILGGLTRSVTGLPVAAIGQRERNAEARRQIQIIDAILNDKERSLEKGRYVYFDEDAFNLRRRKDELEAYIWFNAVPK